MRINLFLDAIFVFDASRIKQHTPQINEQPASRHKQLGTVSETSSKVGWRTSSVSLLCMTSLELDFLNWKTARARVVTHNLCKACWEKALVFWDGKKYQNITVRKKQEKLAESRIPATHFRA